LTVALVGLVDDPLREGVLLAHVAQPQAVACRAAQLAVVLQEEGLGSEAPRGSSQGGRPLPRAILLRGMFLLRPFTNRGTSPIIMLVVTLGVSLILQNIILAIFSEQFQNYSMNTGSPLSIGPFLFTPLQLGIIGLAIVTMLGIHLLLRYTRLGKAMRAVSDSPELARISGINTRLIVNAVWLLAGGLGGLSGVVLAFNVASFTPTVGFGFLFIIFAAVILGGIGSPYGAIAGALVVGIATEVSASFISSEYKNAIALVILIIALLIRPQGIFASRGRA
jgi:branched-subunit amino acid ABC-type transport system permease component